MKKFLARYGKWADQTEIGFALGWVGFALVYGIGESLNVEEEGILSGTGLLYILIGACTFAAGTLLAKKVNGARRDASYQRGRLDGFDESQQAFFHSFDKFFGYGGRR